MRTVGQRITVYASSNDRALQASAQYQGYQRAGDTTPDVTIIEGIDTVDASATDTSLLGHSYFGDRRTLLADLYYLLRDGLEPARRIGLDAMGQPPRRHWVFSLGIEKNRLKKAALRKSQSPAWQRRQRRTPRTQIGVPRIRSRQQAPMRQRIGSADTKAGASKGQPWARFPPSRSRSSRSIALISARSSSASTLAGDRNQDATGSLPQNVNWAVKGDLARTLVPGTAAPPPVSSRDNAIKRASSASCLIVARSAR